MNMFFNSQFSILYEILSIINHMCLSSTFNTVSGVAYSSGLLQLKFFNVSLHKIKSECKYRQFVFMSTCTYTVSLKFAF